MTDELKQALSESVDDELRGSQSRFLASRLLADREMRGRWERYHLIGEVLRGSVITSRWSPGFADRVMDGLATEPEHHSSVLVRRRKLLAGGMAAAIAVVALVGSLQWLNSDPAMVPGISQTVARSESAGFSAQLDAYIAGHQELMAISGGQGMLPYVRLTSELHDAGEQQ